jgi:AraC-like DNA-binding protein
MINTAQNTRPTWPARTAGTRVIAGSADWRIVEFVCTSGPADKPFEEYRDYACAAVVLEGTFDYSCDNGRALLHPGAVMLGNPATCYECGHAHSRGDRCLAFQLAPHYFDEIAHTVTRRSRSRFPVAMLPAGRASLTTTAAALAYVEKSDTGEPEALLVSVFEEALTLTAGSARGFDTPAAAHRRVADVIRLLGTEWQTQLDLGGLAEAAGLSKYHLLRTFRSIVGTTPYRYLLDTRLRYAAAELATGTTPVSTIAYDAGFGDLSTFNRHFKTRFGVSPSRYRRQASDRRHRR